MTAVVTVTDAEKRGRFEARVDGTLAGFVEYVRDQEEVEYTHTVVSRGHRGQGIGGELARTVLEDARRRGLTVKPTCAYIARWISHHPAYQDLVN